MNCWVLLEGLGCSSSASRALWPGCCRCAWVCDSSVVSPALAAVSCEQCGLQQELRVPAAKPGSEQELWGWELSWNSQAALRAVSVCAGEDRDFPVLVAQALQCPPWVPAVPAVQAGPQHCLHSSGKHSLLRLVCETLEYV